MRLAAAASGLPAVVLAKAGEAELKKTARSAGVEGFSGMRQEAADACGVAAFFPV